jgi:hypothetical protein
MLWEGMKGGMRKKIKFMYPSLSDVPAIVVHFYCLKFHILLFKKYTFLLLSTLPVRSPIPIVRPQCEPQQSLPHRFWNTIS